MKSHSSVAFLLGLILFSALPASSPAATTWLTDLPKAQAQAKAENKAVLINFTGSDWCGWCIRLRKEVFAKPDFEEYASQNLVLVEIDFPKRKELPDALKKANRALAGKFDVEGYPTLIVLGADGQKLGKLGYAPGGTKAFLSEMSKTIGKKAATGTPVQARESSGSTVPAPAAKTEAKNAKAAKPAPAPWPPTQAGGLVLKGISGPKEKRLALVNNQTLTAGETAYVRVAGGLVRVHCLEIRDDIVVVTIDGREGRQELKLWNGL
jgi:thioredoxin-related protein